MNTTTPATHAAGLWLIWSGIVSMVLVVLLAAAWWLLPRWLPQWVAANSPWPEPALRSLRYDASAMHGRGFVERLTDYGPAIGPALLRQYGAGDTQHRLRMLLLANELTDSPGMSPRDGRPPPPRFTADDLKVLREELVELARLALTEGSMELGETAAFVAARLGDRRLTSLLCGLVVGQTTPIGPEVANVVVALGVLGDPQAVGTLIPLLPIRHRTQPDVERALALCQDDSTFPLVLTALRHEHPVVRTWAADQMPRYLPMGIVDPARWAVVEARRALAGMELLTLNQHVEDLFVQRAQIEALGTVRFHPAGPHLRALTAHPDERVRGKAILALGHLADPADFPLLLRLLHDDEDIARKARIALGHLPLTQDQQRQVDVFWDALENDPGPAASTPPTSSASPAAP